MRELWAWRTSATIWASTVSPPTRLTRKQKLPLRLIEAPMTLSPAALATGVGSPVSIDSSTQELPSLTTPSVGIFSPGRTCTRSLTTTCDTGISIGWPSRSTRAVGGCSCSSLRMAAEVWPRARASSNRPSSTRVRITAADS